jgi:hypothetical protein
VRADEKLTAFIELESALRNFPGGGGVRVGEDEIWSVALSSARQKKAAPTKQINEIFISVSCIPDMFDAAMIFARDALRKRVQDSPITIMAGSFTI